MTERTAIDLFNDALELESDEARKQFLKEECLEDASMREHVQKLLAAHLGAGNFLPMEDCATASGAIRSDSGLHESAMVGKTIGPYKIREQIGQGGMGAVYVADQTEPVRRRVALKLIRSSLPSSDVVGRFEAERQALAMMNHPNIARVLDGGTTDSGQPYFAMELVQGLPITEYCDERKLSTEDRLGLFLDVCRAVQHAHQRGIIHRDLKPSNILVAEVDDKAIVKVIDFGVAKAIDQKLTDQTVYTQFTQMIGTPMYMSPEQAGFGVLDIDTRSDVYSLGVLLYELLTGNAPFDGKTLKSVGYDEMRRMIREDEPRRPSVMVSTLDAEVISTVSERRRCDPRRLVAAIRGELDWIVMKSLEKDRARRYGSADALVADIERYLVNEPVEACPPSFIYTARKYAARHRALFLSTVLVLAISIIAAGVSTWHALRANEARELADQRLVLSQADFERANDAIDRVIERLMSDEFDQMKGIEAVRHQLFDDTLKINESLLNDHRDTRLARHRRAKILLRVSEARAISKSRRKAFDASNEAIQIYKELVSEFPEDAQLRIELAGALNRKAWGPLFGEKSQDDARLELAQESIAQLEGVDPGVLTPEQTSDFRRTFGAAYGIASRYSLNLGQNDRALDFARRGVELELEAPAYEADMWRILSRAQLATGQLVEGEESARKAVDAARRVLDLAPEAFQSHRHLHNALRQWESALLKQDKKAETANVRELMFRNAQNAAINFPDRPGAYASVVDSVRSDMSKLSDTIDLFVSESRYATIRAFATADNAWELAELIRYRQTADPEGARQFLRDVLRAYTELINNAPQDTHLYVSRGRLHAQFADYHAAFHDMKRAIELGENDGSKVFHTALLELECGNHEFSEQACRQMLKESQMANSVDFERDVYMGWIAVLHPSALDDYSAAIERVQDALEDSPRSVFAKCVLGGLYLRAGHSEDANHLLQSLLPRLGNETGAIAFVPYLLALTEIQLGNMDSANHYLSLANENTTKQRSIPWDHSLILERLRTEAEQLINATEASEN